MPLSSLNRSTGWPAQPNSKIRRLFVWNIHFLCFMMCFMHFCATSNILLLFPGNGTIMGDNEGMGNEKCTCLPFLHFLVFSFRFHNFPGFSVLLTNSTLENWFFARISLLFSHISNLLSIISGGNIPWETHTNLMRESCKIARTYHHETSQTALFPRKVWNRIWFLWFLVEKLFVMSL